MPRTRRNAPAGVIGLVLALLASLWLTTAPAYAAGSPPVTADDAATMFAGNVVVVEVLANDTDPDSDELAICRVPESTSRKFEVFADGDQLVVISTPSAPPGDYTFSYYACDFDFLTQGTLTVTIEPEPDITVKKIASRPGKLKIKNPGNFKIEVLYGSFREPEPDDVVVLRKHSTLVITVHRTKINWIAYHAKRGDFLRIGRVKNITLPPGDEFPAAGRVLMTQRMAKLWLTH